MFFGGIKRNEYLCNRSKRNESLCNLTAICGSLSTTHYYLKFAVSHTIAFRMEFPRIATHTTFPTETDETAEL